MSLLHGGQLSYSALGKPFLSLTIQPWEANGFPQLLVLDAPRPSLVPLILPISP